MKNVHFEPWVGENYRNGGIFGKRILVLGESHYGDDLGKSMTEEVLCGHACSNQTYSAYTNFERALVGRITNEDDRKQIWNSVAFYNYIQKCMPEPRVSPTKEEFETAEKAFFEVLENLKPDLILAWGTRLYERMTYTNFQSLPNLEYEGYVYRKGTYTVSGKVIPIYEIQHPSSGFSWDWWNRYLKKNGVL